jgi:hypothetical protein
MKGLGYILWHARHEFYHILLGLLWVWILRERWGQFHVTWIALALVGSLLPDVDHLVYWFGYGKNDHYTVQIKKFFKARQWRDLMLFIEKGHKGVTTLSSHNLYVTAILLVSGLLSSFYSWRGGVILAGAMFIHYAFDIADDLVQLGAMNANWKRWGRGVKHRSS